MKNTYPNLRFLEAEPFLANLAFFFDGGETDESLKYITSGLDGDDKIAELSPLKLELQLRSKYFSGVDCSFRESEKIILYRLLCIFVFYFNFLFIKKIKI